MTLAELELETLKDSDVVGGASSLYRHKSYVDYTMLTLFGMTSTTVRAILPGAALYTTTHYKDTACKTMQLA